MANIVNRSQLNPRWRRYSLRSLFVLMTIAAIVMGWFSYQVRRERFAIKQLSLSLDGHQCDIWYASRLAPPKVPFDVMGKPSVPSVRASGWLDQIVGADVFRTPVSIRCFSAVESKRLDYDKSGRLQIDGEYSGGLADDDLRWVNMLMQLKYLHLSGNDVTGQGVAELRDLRRLESLELSSTSITDDGLEVLTNMPRLRVLDLSYTRVSDASVDVLSRCESLKELRLVVTNVTENGIAILQEALPNCTIEH